MDKETAKALIIDDNEVCRRKAEIILSKLFDVETAADGLEGFKRYCQSLNENEPFSLILLDIRMPLMDGVVALEAIREAEKLKGTDYADGAKIIMITACDTNDKILSSFRKGCEAYLVKPYTSEKLLEEVAKLGLLKYSTV